MELTNTKQIHYTLRLAVSMCCIGHGAFGVITKQIWCNYFALFGIGPELAYRLMPLVGTVDILLGMLVLLYPMRAVLVWLVTWGFLTATFRPLSGEPFAELIERAGNFGAPLALLIWSGRFRWNRRDLFTPLQPAQAVGAHAATWLFQCLRITVFFLLTGHGWLNLVEKTAILSQYSSLGFADPRHISLYVGIFEIGTATLVLLKPLRPIVFMLLFWKIGSELFYPRYEFFEWIERGGSYGCLLALWFALSAKSYVMNGRAVPGAHPSMT